MDPEGEGIVDHLNLEALDAGGGRVWSGVRFG
jgi:hypothetical protein